MRKGESVDGDEVFGRRGMSRVGKDRIHGRCEQEVCEQNLLHQAHRDQTNSGSESIGARGAAARDLGQEFVAAQDGAGDELRKEAHEQRVIPETREAGQSSAVGIDRESEDLEGIERDSEGQHDGRNRRSRQRETVENRDGALDQERGVLERGQQTEAQAAGESQKQAGPAPGNDAAKQSIVEPDGRDEQHQIGRYPQEVEEKAGAEEEVGA